MEGLQELRQQLRKLPEDLAREAGAIVIAHAEEAQRRIQSAYPEGPTGNLKRGVTAQHQGSALAATAIVRSRAKHAWLFENGTAPRRTQRGAYRGRMPAAPDSQQMIPIVIQARRRMVSALIQMVQKAGLEVTSS